MDQQRVACGWAVAAVVAPWAKGRFEFQTKLSGFFELLDFGRMLVAKVLAFWL